MTTYAIAAAVIFGVNLLPAFGPPTWAVLVFFRVRYGLDAVPLIAIGGVAAASGRFLLATGAAHFHDRMSERRRANLTAAADALRHKGRGVAVLGLFALSPLPSAQLFIAAGLMQLELIPLTLAFFAGRLVSYTIYVTAASAASTTVSHLIGKSLGSPLAIGLQIAMLALLVVLTRVDWLHLRAKRQSP